jgi:hypothetical protein
MDVPPFQMRLPNVVVDHPIGVAMERCSYITWFGKTVLLAIWMARQRNLYGGVGRNFPSRTPQSASQMAGNVVLNRNKIVVLDK